MDVQKYSPGTVLPRPGSPAHQLATSDWHRAKLRITELGVIVPAHNEEELISDCLDSIEIAARGIDLPVRTLVVLDHCTDETAEVVGRRCGVDVLSLTSGDAGVGAARAAGVAELLRGSDHRSTWVATTDADSVVPADWFSRQLGHIRNGAEAIVGTVQIADWTKRDPNTRQRYLAAYRGGMQNPSGADAPWGTRSHQHIHGANLSFSAASYLAAGGFDDQATTDEDVSLITRLEAAGCAVFWAADLPVITSSRPDGRAPSGFAGYLNRLETSGQHRRSAAPAQFDDVTSQ